jgi:hypothetical protein
VRPTIFAASTMNFVTSFAADPVTISTFHPSAAVDFSITPALQCASCRPHDQQNSASAPAPQLARDVTEPQNPYSPPTDECTHG